MINLKRHDNLKTAVHEYQKTRICLSALSDMFLFFSEEESTFVKEDASDLKRKLFCK